MKDEIKEILRNCEKALNEASGYNDTTNKILDCITNLQEENKDLSRMCELYSKSLYCAELTDYKSRIEKAINFISKKIRDVALYGDQYFDLNELLQILKGVGKDD